ncbi:hypothetical protein HELRODRAFT_149347, partial [Helobdella robusta]|uniref:PDEase domain-containing protein n=1 Tax=Helobdella robusta TaxID=6412 RepID=T1EKC8_HELRO
LLANVNKWSFNVFVLDWFTNGHSFPYLVTHLFHTYNFIRTFKLDALKLYRTIRLVELGYCKTNPYHNSLHAADVVQAIHCNLLEENIYPHMTSLEMMAAILSAACHDLDHPGVNQNFLTSSSHYLVSLYNGVSVLENHHWKGTISILHESQVFQHLPSHQWKRLTYLIEILILATDISKQQEILRKFKVDLTDKHVHSHRHKQTIVQIALKCADICNPCRSWKVSRKWSQLICEEFFRQGDREKDLNLPLTTAYDRTQSTTAKIQTAGFMSFIVEPLFIEWDKFSPSHRSKQMLLNLRCNRVKWAEIEKKENEEVDGSIRRQSNTTLVS